MIKKVRYLKDDPSGLLMSEMNPAAGKHLGDYVEQLVNHLRKKHLKTYNIRKTLKEVIRDGLMGNALDFNTLNRRTSFIRTKRKSLFGLNLLQKQKLDAFVPSLGSRRIRASFGRRNRIPIESVQDYAIGVSGLLHSMNKIKRDAVYGDNDNTVVDGKTFVVPVRGNASHPVLRAVPCKSELSINVFTRTEPLGVITDHRLFMVSTLSSANGMSGIPYKTGGLLAHYNSRKD